MFLKSLSVRVFFAASLSLSCSLVVKSAQAQNLYLTSGVTTFSDASHALVSVGLDSNRSTVDPVSGAPYVATANVATGGWVDSLDAYNTSTVNINGGSVNLLYGIDNSNININSGGVLTVFGIYSSASIINGGSVYSAQLFDNSTLLINGGANSLVDGFDNSRTTIAGGTMAGAVYLNGRNSTTNFVGSNLSFAYAGYGREGSYKYGDKFTISGTFDGVVRSYNLYVVNNANANGIANSSPRQFTFNGLSPTIVPEMNTIALISPVLLCIGGMVRRRNTRS